MIILKNFLKIVLKINLKLLFFFFLNDPIAKVNFKLDFIIKFINMLHIESSLMRRLLYLSQKTS